MKKKKKIYTTSKVVGSNADYQGSLWWVLTTQPNQTFPILRKWKKGRQMDFTFLPYVRLGQCFGYCTTSPRTEVPGDMVADQVASQPSPTSLFLWHQTPITKDQPGSSLTYTPKETDHKQDKSFV